MTTQETLTAGDFVTPTVRLVRPLAEGGMGRVWVADHLGLDTQVVVKLMAEEMAARPDGAERFTREAAAAAAIKSPHVVQVFDHGLTTAGVPYIVMELLEGKDLGAHLVERGKMEPHEVVALVLQLGKALTKAHRAGIVHRDIKPDNIFLCDTRDPSERDLLATDPSDPHSMLGSEIFVKLLDFGTAKRAPPLPRTTVPGQIMGTPYYMSPEQSIGGELDARSDLWSLGIVVFEALTGQKPFDGPSIGAITMAIHGSFPKATDRAPELPVAVDAWFAQACAQDPEQRFASARAASAAFVEAMTGLAPADQPTESVFFPPVSTRRGTAPVTPSPGPNAERTPLHPVTTSMAPLSATLPDHTRSQRWTTIAAGLVMALAAVAMIAIVASRSTAPAAPAPVLGAQAPPSAPKELPPAKDVAPRPAEEPAAPAPPAAPARAVVAPRGDTSAPAKPMRPAKAIPKPNRTPLPPKPTAPNDDDLVRLTNATAKHADPPPPEVPPAVEAPPAPAPLPAPAE